MGTFIIKLADHYLEWSSIVDAPVTHGMTLEEFKAYYRDEYGRNDFELKFPRRLARVEQKGTSAHDSADVDDLIWGNCAGPGGTQLHREEIIEFYVRRKSRITPAALAAFRKGLKRCGPKCPARWRNDCRSRCDRCWGTDFVREVRS